jgi:hypothetical protein
VPQSSTAQLQQRQQQPSALPGGPSAESFTVVVDATTGDIFADKGDGDGSLSPDVARAVAAKLRELGLQGLSGSGSFGIEVVDGPSRAPAGLGNGGGFNQRAVSAALEKLRGFVAAAAKGQDRARTRAPLAATPAAAAAAAAEVRWAATTQRSAVGEAKAARAAKAVASAIPSAAEAEAAAAKVATVAAAEVGAAAQRARSVAAALQLLGSRGLLSPRHTAALLAAAVAHAHAAAAAAAAAPLFPTVPAAAAVEAEVEAGAGAGAGAGATSPLHLGACAATWAAVEAAWELLLADHHFHPDGGGGGLEASARRLKLRRSSQLAVATKWTTTQRTARAGVAAWVLRRWRRAAAAGGPASTPAKGGAVVAAAAPGRAAEVSAALLPALVARNEVLVDEALAEFAEQCAACAEVLLDTAPD